MIGRDAARAQREHRETRVPHRRLARLGTEPVAVVDHEALPALDGAAQRRILEAVAERGERDDPPDPRRLDPAPRSVRLLPLADPLLGDGERLAAERGRPARRARASGNRADVAQVDVRVAHGPERLRDRERDERLPRPAREVVDRERRRRRQQHELRRDRNHPLPRPLAEQREEALREEPALRDPALALDVRACARPRVDAAHAQRDVRLDRRREIRRAFEPDRPRSVVAHAREQLVRDSLVELRRAQSEEVVPEEMLRGHRHVRLELADPDSVVALQLEQAPRAAVDRRVEARQRRGGRGHAATAAAAARPLRTALSIVAGQPVSVHAPARTTFARAVAAPARAMPGRSAIVA